MQTLATRIEGSVAVIGDLHGQAEELRTLLDKLCARPDFQRRWIVFIGDFVDRGPDPKSVLDMVCDLCRDHPKTTAIAGNHEFAMAAALGWIPTPDYSNWSDRWVDHYETEPTFASYVADFGDLQDLAARIPKLHKDFLANLPWCVEHRKYLFVHAGLDPNTPFDMQLRILRQKDFSLNQPQWLCSQKLVQADVPPDCPLTVVSGHEFVPEVKFRQKRILIDTSGGRTGDLSCVLLPENKVIASSGALVGGPSRSWGKIW